MKKTMVWIRGILIFGQLFLSVAAGTAGADQITPGEGKLAARRIVRLELRNAELADVLRLFSKEYALNIVAGRDISGTVTISLNQVDAADALRTILVANGYDYEQVGDIYMVTTRENILARRKNLLEGEALETRIFWLNYLGAQDLARVIEKELSPRGNLRFLSQTILNGWEMGGVSGSETSGELGRKIRLKKEQDEKAPVLVVSDIPAVLNRVGALIRELDVKPEQVLIEAVIVEVNSEMVRDLGIEWKYTHTDGDITSGFIPGTVTPPAPGFTGLEVAYDRAVGENPLMVTLRALEEKKKANILSRPRIMALHNQEATILVGERYPILESTITGTPPNQYITESLSHYEPIGVTLRVIPRVVDGGRINLLLHPEISSLGPDVEGVSGVVYKRINTREADTNVSVTNGQTMVIGGLLTNVKEDNVYKVPFLGDIPLLGNLFKRVEKRPAQRELLIFITPRLMLDDIGDDSALMQDKTSQFR